MCYYSSVMKIGTDVLQKGKVVPVIDAANEIGVHFTTLYRWIQAGKIVYVTFGDTIFIPVLEVERIKKNKMKEAQGVTP
ncbi:hypothetical protein ES703_122403 [subsurface metagenome]